MVTPVRISILLCRPRSWTSAKSRSPMRGGAYIGTTLAISSRGTARVVKPYFMIGLSISCIEPLLPRQPADGRYANRPPHRVRAETLLWDIISHYLGSDPWLASGSKHTSQSG